MTRTVLDPDTGRAENLVRYICPMCQNSGRTWVPQDPKERHAVRFEGRLLMPGSTEGDHASRFAAPCVNPDCAFGMATRGQIPAHRAEIVREILTRHYDRVFRRPTPDSFLSGVESGCFAHLSENKRQALAEWLATCQRREKLVREEGLPPSEKPGIVKLAGEAINPLARGRQAAMPDRRQWWHEGEAEE